MSLALLPLARVSRSILVGFYALSMIMTVSPFTSIGLLACKKVTVPVIEVIFPLAVVCVQVCVDHFASPIFHISLPRAIVDRLVRPLLHPCAFPDVLSDTPLSYVPGPIGKLKLFSAFTLLQRLFELEILDPQLRSLP